MKRLKVTTMDGGEHLFQAFYRDIFIDTEQSILVITNRKSEIIALFAAGAWQSAIAIDERDEDASE